MSEYRAFVRKDTEGGIDATLGNLGDLVTLKEAAEATRLSSKTIRAAITRGALPAFIPGNRNKRTPGRGMGYRIKKADLQSWFFGAARGEA